jgi:hypothetical protein
LSAQPEAFKCAAPCRFYASPGVLPAHDPQMRPVSSTRNLRFAEDVEGSNPSDRPMSIRSMRSARSFRSLGSQQTQVMMMMMIFDIRILPRTLRDRLPRTAHVDPQHALGKELPLPRLAAGAGEKTGGSKVKIDYI